MSRWLGARNWHDFFHQSRADAIPSPPRDTQPHVGRFTRSVFSSSSAHKSIQRRDDGAVGCVHEVKSIQLGSLGQVMCFCL